MHLQYVALHEVKRCMVVWCTQNARDGSNFMWHQPCQQCTFTTSVDIKKTRYKKTIHSCRITCESSESARQRRIALYKSDTKIFKKCLNHLNVPRCGKIGSAIQYIVWRTAVCSHFPALGYFEKLNAVMP